MPRSTANALIQAGFEAVDVRDIGLRGHSDDDIFAEAQTRGAVIVTEDLHFADVLRFRPAAHAGMIVLRVPSELSTRRVNEILLQALAELTGEDLMGTLVIVEAGRVRIRRS